VTIASRKYVEKTNEQRLRELDRGGNHQVDENYQQQQQQIFQELNSIRIIENEPEINEP